MYQALEQCLCPLRLRGKEHSPQHQHPVRQKKPRSCFLPGVDSLFRERESLFTKSLLKKYPSTKHGRRCSPERHVVVRRQSEQLFRDVLPVVDVSSEMREHEVKEQREGQGVWLIELSCADHGTL